MVYCTDNYGKAFVRYCEPISLKDRIEKFIAVNGRRQKDLLIDKKLKKQFIKELSREFSVTLTENTVIMATSIISSLILAFRKGLEENTICRWYQYVFQRIVEKKGLMSAQHLPSKNVIKQSLRSYLTKFIDVKRNMYEPNVTPNKDYKNILMLGYYRNVLVHHFLLDSYTVLSIMSKWNNQPQPKKVVWEDVSFLSHIFQHEFMVRN